MIGIPGTHDVINGREQACHPAKKVDSDRKNEFTVSTVRTPRAVRNVNGTTRKKANDQIEIHLQIPIASKAQSITGTRLEDLNTGDHVII